MRSQQTRIGDSRGCLQNWAKWRPSDYEADN
jgi:hypothetical protein